MLFNVLLGHVSLEIVKYLRTNVATLNKSAEVHSISLTAVC